MKASKIKRFVYLSAEIDEWLKSKSKDEFRTVSSMVASLLEAARKSEALSAPTLKASSMTTETQI